MLPIASDADIVAARIYARKLAKDLGFDPLDQARIATTVSELASNIYLYAQAGAITVRPLDYNGRRGLELQFCDHGPGIGNLELAMQDGYSTSHGMGMGLPGAQRLMHEFEIRSTVGVGTTVICRKWLA